MWNRKERGVGVYRRSSQYRRRSADNVNTLLMPMDAHRSPRNTDRQSDTCQTAARTKHSTFKTVTDKPHGHGKLEGPLRTCNNSSDQTRVNWSRVHDKDCKAVTSPLNNGAVTVVFVDPTKYAMLNRQHNSDTLCLACPVDLLFTIHMHIYAFFEQKKLY